ncbi:hypothetical protein [Microbacterium sp. MPKO10]|uniref:hypothetical protein n=1 Tax=Microbacterium sp. MPKO10 TaxID=2989818 RepID=UPI002235707D|nr:hypothetical protein [Microbacterium sp. MPKO10]MCW4458168.1 hypothetical protein [Microbacterium sp. MPKO10]
MTKGFVASNGWHFDEDGTLYDANGDLDAFPESVAKLELAFTERRDAELGRWRDTVEPHIVCYSRGRDYVRVTSERSGEYWEFKRGKVVAASTAECAAERYFQAHSIRKPLPTAEGFYVNRSLFVQQVATASILVHFEDGGWGFEDDLGSDATDIAQEWHDAGQLVRLAPVESEVGE